MKTEIVHSKTFDRHDNNGHPENATRTQVMMTSLKFVHMMTSLNVVHTDEHYSFSIG